MPINVCHKCVNSSNVTVCSPQIMSLVNAASYLSFWISTNWQLKRKLLLIPSAASFNLKSPTELHLLRSRKNVAIKRWILMAWNWKLTEINVPLSELQFAEVMFVSFQAINLISLRFIQILVPRLFYNALNIPKKIPRRKFSIKICISNLLIHAYVRTTRWIQLWLSVFAQFIELFN